MKWRAAAGVLCYGNIPDRLKSKIYRAVFRPVAMYATECWPVTKEAERRLDGMEMKMLRMTAGITRLDRVSNMDVRRKFGVAPISSKMRESRLRWYGHVLRGDENTLRKIGLKFDVPGRRPGGRPKQRWPDNFHADLKVDRAQDRRTEAQRTLPPSETNAKKK